MDKIEPLDAAERKPMKLIGSYLSPYTRRVAISLDALEQPYEFEVVSVIAEPQRIQPYNPVIRIPVLLMPDGEALIESYAILDEIDQRVGPERALVPRSGAARRVVMQITALALACMEKAQSAFYEGRFRPESMVYTPWVRHNDNQVLGGLRSLDNLAAKLKTGDWLAGTLGISQADITATIVCSSINLIRPRLNLTDEFPHLVKFATRCEDLAIFRKSPLPDSLPPAPILPNEPLGNIPN
jgi:glutathione S-transferase